jgi:hypothetical protein
MRRAWFVLAVTLLASASSAFAAASVKIVFERQEGPASDWTPAAPVKRTLGIAWDERARADGKTAVFARTVTLTYSLAPGLSLSSSEVRSFRRELEEALRDGLPTARRPVVVASDGDAAADYRAEAADRLIRLIDDKGIKFAASGSPLELPAQAVVVAP